MSAPFTLSVPVELQPIVSEWDKLVAVKWEELRAAQGHFISAHSPQWTQAEDTRRRSAARVGLMQWSEAWFLAKGVCIRCVPDGDNCDGFGLSLITDHP
jgi:hypothetical protein